VPGDAFYDRDRVLERYTASRPPGQSSPNQVMEEPAVLAALGDDIAGARVLDLGCGDAAIATELVARGCASYHGVDVSSRMVAAARTTLARLPVAATVEHADLATFAAPPASFDLVLSRLALHYVADLACVLTRCHTALVPGGRLVVTVQHPVITSHDARASSAQPRTSWTVDDYFTRGPRDRDWHGSTVTWHHRTVEDHVCALLTAGFTLTTLSECEPDPTRFAKPEELTRRRRIPLFLLLAATRR
jgi:SAM-dependent methyltransferase